jgi:hypothetical protein
MKSAQPAVFVKRNLSWPPGQAKGIGLPMLGLNLLFHDNNSSFSTLLDRTERRYEPGVRHFFDDIEAKMQKWRKAVTRLGDSRKLESDHGMTPQAEAYERLALLNQHSSALTTILVSLGNNGLIPKKDSAFYRSMVEEVRALSSQWVLEALDEREVRTAAKASKGVSRSKRSYPT